jgi:hypothetical protein
VAPIGQHPRKYVAHACRKNKVIPADWQKDEFERFSLINAAKIVRYLLAKKSGPSLR